MMNTINVELFAANTVIEKLRDLPPPIAQLAPETKRNVEHVKFIFIDRITG